LAISRLMRSHIADLYSIVKLNDPTLPDLMLSDVTSWLERGEQKREHYIVALLGEKVVGMTGFKPDAWGAADIAWLVWLYVHPDYKRQGIASQLFHAAQDQLREQGVRKAYLDVGNADRQPDAIAFHERDGFVLEGALKDYWAPGEDFLIFGKNLRAGG